MNNDGIVSVLLPLGEVGVVVVDRPRDTDDSRVSVAFSPPTGHECCCCCWCRRPTVRDIKAVVENNGFAVDKSDGAVPVTIWGERGLDARPMREVGGHQVRPVRPIRLKQTDKVFELLRHNKDGID